MTVTILSRDESTKIYDDHSTIGVMAVSEALVVAAAQGKLKERHRIGAWVRRLDGSSIAQETCTKLECNDIVAVNHNGFDGYCFVVMVHRKPSQRDNRLSSGYTMAIAPTLDPPTLSTSQSKTPASVRIRGACCRRG